MAVRKQKAKTRKKNRNTIQKRQFCRAHLSSVSSALSRVGHTSEMHSKDASPKKTAPAKKKKKKGPEKRSKNAYLGCAFIPLLPSPSRLNHRPRHPREGAPRPKRPPPTAPTCLHRRPALFHPRHLHCPRRPLHSLPLPPHP